ncbi:hypothetical protein L596_029914 [Steinernema carpocapsae]|nr:hypothetical protein L596_029914 [Steinernema carpocapsae]
MAGGVCPENYKCISDNTCWMVRATRREMDVTAEERRFKRSHLYMGVCMNLIGPCQEGSCPSGFTCRVDNNCWSTNVEVPAN